MFDPSSSDLRAAVLRVELRAERAPHDEVLQKAYVQNRILDELQNERNQLVFGRRGVGKTHTLKVFLSPILRDGCLGHYIDLRSFGSALGTEGTSLSIAIRFYTTTLRHLCDRFLEDVLLMEWPSGEAKTNAENSLYALSAACEPRGGTFEYAKLNELVNAFLVSVGARRLYLVLDEWAEIPRDAQPYFAELLKRSFFANPKVTLKIAVVDYAYRLSLETESGTLGLEKSADVFSDVRMDRYFVWDEDRDFVERFFSNVLYNHLAIEMKGDLDISPEEKHQVVLRDLFTQSLVFSKLCRACEGNARDLLFLFTRAFEEFRRNGSGKRAAIGHDDVDQAAINWFRQDKLANISSESNLEDFLEFLTNSIIRNRRARTFMVPRRDIGHPLLQRLFSARILHPLTMEWSHPEKPGERFHLVTIEYGAYASFKNTRAEPIDQFLFDVGSKESEQVDDLVPFDDRRSIRRIVVTATDMDKFTPSRK